MKATINIMEDIELRASIKDSIRGLVRSIVKEDITALVKEQFAGYIKNTSQSRVDTLFKEVCKDLIRQELKVSYFSSNESPIVKEALKAEVLEQVKVNLSKIEEQVIKTAASLLTHDKVVDRLIKKLAE